MTTSTTTTIIPEALQVCALFAYQNGLITPWNTFYDAAMSKIAGTSKAGISNQVAARPKTPARGPSKRGQAILAVLTSEGLPMRAIVTATGLKTQQVKTALSTMQKRGTAYLKNSRWFAGTAPAKAASKQPGTRQRKAPVAKPTDSISLSDATIRAVQFAGQEGAVQSSILNYLSREFGMTVRANHLGIALQRHLRAGRLTKRDDRWYTPNVEELRPTG